VARNLGLLPAGAWGPAVSESEGSVTREKLRHGGSALKRRRMRAGIWSNVLVSASGDGEVETHENQVDVITVVSGAGTLVVGGTGVDMHQTALNELRGKSITGGETHKMAPGDVFHIPANMPHQMLVPKSLVIEVVKVTTK
jgi:mannose-6-phosphate isomerase-like protein (cupin superfamily)